MARARRVSKLEGRDAVLVEIREGEAPVLLRHHLADDLRANIVAVGAGRVRQWRACVSGYALAYTVQVPHAVVVALLVVSWLVDCVAEGEGGFGDILRLEVLRAYDGECSS